ncbi:hypothetical protein FAM15381_001790 [Propionibacterium freudenreichii]|nr:hypothetical protein [Propionibacterium freudenreichii]MDK9651493.1 hypothetical protein [Propionibacterium freudenreichii]
MGSKESDRTNTGSHLARASLKNTVVEYKSLVQINRRQLLALDREY